MTFSDPVPSRHQSFYESPKWRRVRENYLRLEPFCVVCGDEATEVDHIKPISEGGHWRVRQNLRAMCKSCHARKTWRDRRRRRTKVFGLDGWKIEE